MTAYELGRYFAYWGLERFVFTVPGMQQPFDCGYCDEMESYS